MTSAIAGLALGLFVTSTMGALAEGPGFALGVFPASESFPRNSEGSIIELTDGRLYLVGTRFYGGRSDHSEANVVARRSSDGGRTWDEPTVVQENVGGQNVMSASLQRLTDQRTDDGKRAAGPIGFFYLIKNSAADLRVYMRTSTDETETWSEPVCVTERPGYHVMNNDRVLLTSTGRLICPVAWSPDYSKENHFRCVCFLSDDQGRTWRPGKAEVDLPKRGAMEPEVIEKRDGSLLMLMRTQLGLNYAAISKDAGETWDGPEPFGPPAPEAPSTLRRIPSTGDWLLVFNDNVEPGAGHGGKRTPLSAAVSRDEGATWQAVRHIETREDQTYAYTSLTFVGNRALMSYYVSDSATGWLSTRFRSVPFEWFYGE